MPLLILFFFSSTPSCTKTPFSWLDYGSGLPGDVAGGPGKGIPLKMAEKMNIWYTV